MANTDVQESFRILENVIFLKKIPLFSSVQTSELQAIAKIAEEVGFDSGEEIVRENDAGDSMYIIRKGTVRIAKKTGQSSTIDLAHLQTGQCFGDMAIFDNELRSASAFASENCIMLRIDRDNLIDVILEYPHIALELLRIFIQRLRDANGRIEQLSKNDHGAPV
jgi:CRP-like cAMP-binding protein